MDRDIYQELRMIGLTHDQCSDVMDLITTLPIQIGVGIENTSVTITDDGIIRVEKNN